MHINGDSCNWKYANFSRAGQSLNLAVNTISNVLHELYQEMELTPSAPEFQATQAIIMIMLPVLALSIF